MSTKNSNGNINTKQQVEIISSKINLNKTPVLDHIKNLTIAGLNAVPYVGSVLASLFDSYIPKQKEKRLLEFVQSLAVEIDKVKNQIKEDVINTDNFAFIFERTFRGAIENYQKEKIDLYKAIFINSITDKLSLNDEEKEIFLNLANDLTVRHIKIMAILRKNNSGELTQVVKTSFPDYDQESIFYIMDDLRNKGLVHYKGTIYDSSLSNNFNQLSKMGNRFVDFITL
ncbi:MAG: hypothetical protein WC625_07560 [Caldisericia bacterium]